MYFSWLLRCPHKFDHPIAFHGSKLNKHFCIDFPSFPALLLLPYSKDSIELEAVMLLGLGRELVLDRGTLSNYKTAVTQHELSISRSKKL